MTATGNLVISFLAIEPATAGILVFIGCVLLVLSFLIAGSEVAFFSLTSKDIKILKTRRQPSFRRIVHLLEQPRPLLAAIMIANNFLNIGIILIANLLLNNWFENAGLGFWQLFALKAFIITFLLVLFVEVLPKVWATQHKVWFATTASLVVDIFNSIFYRLSRRMVRYSERLEKNFYNDSISSFEPIDYAIDQLPEHQATAEEKLILKGIRKFSASTVKQIMRTRLDVSGIEMGCSFEEVKKYVREVRYSRIPVYSKNLDTIKGILHTKDILQHIDKGEEYDWRELLRQAYFVHEQKNIEDLLQDFRQKRIHFAVVVDEFGGTSGIVTLEDIMEEIIGEIEDEFDDEQSINRKIDDNNYIFEGRTMIPDVCRMMKLAPDTFEAVRGDSDSLAGLVLEIAGEFPQVNEKLVSGDFIFEPLEINKNRIDKVKVTVQPMEIQDV